MTEAGLLQLAESLDRDLRAIRRALTRAYETDKERADLTPPQMHAMAILTRPAVASGLTITELRAQMGLSQSTVSGIVARLERRGLVRRETDAADRRLTRIVVTEGVRGYMQQEAAARRLRPLAVALSRASESERQCVLAGIAALRALLADEDPPARHPATASRSLDAGASDGPGDP